MISNSHIIWQWLLSLLSLPVSAVAALPLVIALGLVAGRRGNGSFCLWGNRKLLNLTCFMAPIAPLYYLFLYLIQIFPYSPANVFAPLFSLAGLSYFSCIVCSCVSCIIIFWAYFFLNKAILHLSLSQDKYKMSKLRLPLILCLICAFFSFACMPLQNWPFAGLPDTINWDRAILAIVKNSFRHYFMAFCPAGAIALILAINQQYAVKEQQKAAIRWLSAWAAAGYLPHTLITVGFTIGLAARGSLAGYIASGYFLQIISAVVLIGAMLCWSMLLFGKDSRTYLAYAGLAFLILYVSSPYIVKLGLQILV